MAKQEILNGETGLLTRAKLNSNFEELYGASVTTFDDDETILGTENSTSFTFIGTVDKTLTLPISSTVTFDYVSFIANKSPNGSVLTVVPQAPDLIDGEASFLLNTGEEWRFETDGVDKYFVQNAQLNYGSLQVLQSIENADLISIFDQSENETLSATIQAVSDKILELTRPDRAVWEVLAQSSTTGSTPVVVLDEDHAYTGNQYWAHISFNAGNSSVSGSVVVDFLVDGVQQGASFEMEPKDSDNLFWVAKSVPITLPAGNHNLKVTFHNKGNGTARIDKIRVLLEEKK